jgi:hypothetical protein
VLHALYLYTPALLSSYGSRTRRFGATNRVGLYKILPMDTIYRVPRESFIHISPMQFVFQRSSIIQILCFWTLSIFLSLSKNTVLFIFQNTAFRRLDYVSVFRYNLLSFAQSIEPRKYFLSSRRWPMLCLACITHFGARTGVCNLR